MWDTAGSERFKSLIPTYLKNANSIILTYDITSKFNFEYYFITLILFLNFSKEIYLIR